MSESERAMLMGGACARAYGWSPDKRRNLVRAGAAPIISTAQALRSEKLGATIAA